MKLNGLDLFSGIGGISLALSSWVRTIAYCEADRYAQSVLLQRMADGSLHNAPIWPDVRTLTGEMLPAVDIIFGGFPCQDISIAGNGRGLEGERSGLFFEIMRLADEIKPTFIFLENVPAIRTRGASRVIKELASRRYDCRWHTLSAQEVGANHKRERWFLLAYSNIIKLRNQQKQGLRQSSSIIGNYSEKESLANTDGDRLQKQRIESISRGPTNSITNPSWWEAEPSVGRVVDGLPKRVDRIKCLGNAVVPIQAKTAFEILMGMREKECTKK